MNDRPLLLLARHGSSLGNKEKVFRSRLDFPLDATGEAEAHELGLHIAQHFQPTVIIASPLQRAQATAHIAAQGLHVPVETDGRLLPWDAGRLAGQPRNTYTERIRDFYIQHADRPIPGGESIEASESRMNDFLTSALRYAGKGGLALAIGHGSGIKAAHTLSTGKREPTGDAALVEPGGLVGVYKTPSGLTMKALFKEAPQEAKAS